MTDIIRFAAKQPTSQIDYTADDFLVADYQAGFEEQPYSESTIAITESVLVIVGHVAQVDETIAINETSLTSSQLLRTVDESLAISEQVLTTENLVQQIDELVSIEETTQESLNIIPTPIAETVSITEQVLSVVALGKLAQADDTVSIEEDVIVKLEHIEAPETWSSGITSKRRPKKTTVIQFEKFVPEIEPIITKIVTSKLEIVYDILPPLQDASQSQNKQYEHPIHAATYTKAKDKALASDRPVTPVPVIKVADSVVTRKHSTAPETKSVKKPTFIIPIVTFPPKLTQTDKHLAIPVRQPEIYKQISAFLDAKYDIEEQKVITVQASLYCSYNIKDSRKYQQLLAIQRLYRTMELVELI